MTAMRSTLVNASWFGGLTPNVNTSPVRAANTATIQAAIDASFNFGLGVAALPPGQFYVNPPIFVDPPGNLRTNINNPTNYNFSLELRGAGTLGNNNNQATALLVIDGTQPAVVVGPGQGMKVSSLTVMNTVSYTSRAAQPTGGIGIAISGGGGGAARTLLEHCYVTNFSNGIQTGFNRDGLSDSFNARKCTITQCFRGVNIGNTQNFINLLDDCLLADCKYFLYNPLAKDVTIVGGNFSSTTGYFKALAIGSVSALSAPFTDNYEAQNFNNWTFTVTLSSANQFMTDGAFDGFVIKTVGYGLVPLVLTNYNASTLVATFKFYGGWVLSQTAQSGSFTDLKNSTDIQAELQAQTTLYACERIFTFYGPGISAWGTHIENPGVVTTLATTASTFGGSIRSKFSKLFFNYSIDQNNFNTSGDNLSVFYNQLAWPFLHTTPNLTINVDNLDLGSGGVQNGVNIEMFPYSPPITSASSDWNNPNITIPGSGTQVPGGYGNWSSMSRGGGNFDSTPFFPRGAGAFTAMQQYFANYPLDTPFQGWSPHRSMHPRLTPSLLTTLSGTLPAIGNYPLLNGETLYSVCDFNSGSLASIWARSAHTGFSYGQNVTVNWSYKAASNVVSLSDTTKMFAGLMIGLNNGGGNVYYMVTGVYPALGYVTIAGALAGTVGTTYNGTSITQQAYAISQYPTVGSFTCAAAATTVVSNKAVTATSKIVLTATNAAAATLMGGATSLYISAKSSGVSFTVATANAAAAAGTETFDYEITG